MMEGEEVERMQVMLPPGHVIATMITEHEAILEFLDELDWVNRSIQEMTEYSPDQEEFERLNHIAEHLVETESHHRREEQVLFAELAKRGIEESPEVMRQEHEALRPAKRRLLGLARSAGAADFDAFKEELAELTEAIVPALRAHIFNENNILYPLALQVIDDDAAWQQLKAACDAIGYCCFSPQT
jgi:uncharacterized protein